LSKQKTEQRIEEQTKASLRRCVGCRVSSPKGELIRLVLREGAVQEDPRHRAGGRGAYLHARRECIARAEKEIKRWEYAFRVNRAAVRKTSLESVLEELRMRSVRKEEHVEDTNL
jgi:predicted RNA-binding protein YlxR (DUF448 family)